MSDNDIYGPLINLAVGPSRAVETHIKNWIDTYLSAYESDSALDLYSIARPASWIQTNLLSTYPGEDMSPAIIIIARGANGKPVRQSGGYDIPMDIGIAVVTTSFEGDGAREVGGAYGAAILAILSHRRNIDGAMNGRLRVLEFSDYRLDDLPGEEQRTRGLVRMEFIVNVSNIVKLTGGPATPDPPHDVDDAGTHIPPGSLPTVNEIDVTVTKEDPQ
jgi:hypothetical protein